jgi:Ca2+-binding EF-hand superfamily protein
LNPLKRFRIIAFSFIYLEIDEKPDDHLSFADFLTVVHEYWIPLDDDKQQLQEAFDILDPENKSKMMVDEFVYLLKNCDWPEEDIDLILSQVNCSDGYFLHDGNNHYFHFFIF